MHVLLVGGGGREHAMAWKLIQSSQVSKVSVAPGNPGIAMEENIDCVQIEATDIAALIEFASTQAVHLTIVGPEAPLVLGIVDQFMAKGLRIFGPQQQAAQLEGSKAFAKAFMQEHNIPTATHATFDNAQSAIDWVNERSVPIVIKADGLAAGKGVVVAQSHEEASQTIKAMFDGRFGEAGSTIVIEEFLEGEEASFIVVVSGRDCIALASSQDHKARDEGDMGPNTGGMGAYSPAPIVTAEVHERVMETIVQPTINALADNNMPFLGFLYVGLMIDADANPRVVEFNVRLGDPETQPLMMRLESDLLPLLDHAVDNHLNSVKLTWHDGFAMGVVLAADEYPSGSSHGKAIHGIAEAQSHGCKVFHAGTSMQNEILVTAGGRVLCATATGKTLREAKLCANAGAACIKWDGVRYRKDIGHRALDNE